MSFVATAYEAITVAGSSVGLTAATILNKHSAMLGVETAQIRFTLDGTTPTSTVGTLVDPGYVIYLNQPDQLQKFRAIRVSSSGALRCTYGTGDPGFGILQNNASATGAITGTVGIDQTTPGTTDSVTVKGAAYSVATTITRPANTTVYTAGDVLGGALDLGVLGTSAGVIEIVSSQLEADIAAVPAGQTTFTLYLYSVTPPSAVADNGVFDLPSGDRASFLGAIPVAALADLGATLYAETNDHHKLVKLAGTHLFGYLVTAGGFTPAGNSEVYKLTIGTVVR